MPHIDFDLAAAAREEMIHEGFNPDFPPGTDAQLSTIRARGAVQLDNGVHDLRHMLWSSIDNDDSRDLDQIEVAERVANGIRVVVAIADVDATVTAGTPIDQHASSQTTTVYTGVKTFPMLPEELSTNLTSLNEGADRIAIAIDMVVAPDGCIAASSIYRALVRNAAQLTYSGVGPWLEGTAGAPAKVAASADLQAQLRLQDEAARALREQRHRLGALNFDRVEAQPVMSGGHVSNITARLANQASRLIEDFMIAANEVMARTLLEARVSSIRRVVKTPERWPRIVELAARFGERLPAEADPAALNGFLERRKAADPLHYPDLSLGVMKLMGPGEYVLARPGDPSPGHFGLATNDYTHSTAPNRRFADLVTQRLIKAAEAKDAAPYSDPELDAIARNCTLKEDAARKVQRTMQKRMAAVAMQNRVGETFAGIVTGNTPKGVFEGRLVRGEQGVDVGDQVRVRLVNTDPQRGYIDFAR
jgi:exoribonuclease-2